MHGSIEAVSRNVLTNAFLKERMREKYIYLTKEDFKERHVSKDLVIELIVSLNKESRKLGMTIPIVAISNGPPRTRVMTSDLYSIEKYRVMKVIESSEIEIRSTSNILTCPACKTKMKVIEPSYLPRSCPMGCDINPDRWIGDEEGGLIDVASGRLLLECQETGLQEVQFFLDRDMIRSNSNYKKLTTCIPPRTLLVDAIAVPMYRGGKKASFALWITNVEVQEIQEPLQIGNQADKIVFQAPDAIKAEKDVVNGVFFRNFDYMRRLFQFDHYYQQTSFPDLIIRERNGSARVIEFEFESKNFDLHKHDEKIVDYIVCWVDNRKKKDNVTVVELKKLVGTSI